MNRSVLFPVSTPTCGSGESAFATREVNRPPAENFFRPLRLMHHRHRPHFLSIHETDERCPGSRTETVNRGEVSLFSRIMWARKARETVGNGSAGQLSQSVRNATRVTNSLPVCFASRTTRTLSSGTKGWASICRGPEEKRCKTSYYG